MAFLAIAGAGVFGGGAFGTLAFNAVLGVGMMGLSFLLQGMQKIKGPRLDSLDLSDKAPQGAVVSLNYGENAFYLTPIWIKDNKLIEKSKTKRQGKGGPKVTTYSYYITAAWAIADNKQLSLQKLWMNDKVIIDNVGDSEVTKIDGLRFNLYLGTETQMPDPVMESKLGVGNTPAYRGLCYIVFNELPLEEAGNMIPQLRAQMISAGDRVVLGPIYPYPAGAYTDQVVLDHNTNRHIFLASSYAGGEHRRYNIATGELVATGTKYGTPQNFYNIRPWCADSFGHVYMVEDNYRISVYDASTMSFMFQWDMPMYSNLEGIRRYQAADGSDWILAWGLDDGGPFGSGRTKVIQYKISKSGDVNESTIPYVMYLIGDSVWWVQDDELLNGDGSFGTVDRNDCLWITEPGYNYMMLYKIGVNGYYYWYGTDLFRGQIGAYYDTTPSTFGMEINQMGYYQEEDAIIMLGTPYEGGALNRNKVIIRKYDASYNSNTYFYPPDLKKLDEVIFPLDTPTSGGSTGVIALGTMAGADTIQNGFMVFADHGTTVYKFNLATMSVAAKIEAPLTPVKPRSLIYLDNLNAVVIGDPATGEWRVQLWYFNKYEGPGISLKEIVDDWDKRVLMPPGRSNTAELADQFITGYTLTEQAAVGEPLQDIMGVMGIELADWGAYNKYIVRGKAVPFTIDPADLGASEGDESAEFDLKINVSEAYEIPKVMHLKHFDPKAEFEVSVQEVFRHSAVVASVDITNLSTKVVMDVDKAATKLRNIFKAFWRGRTTYECSLPPKYRKYAPGDVALVYYNDLQHQFIVNEITFDEGVVMMRGTAEDVNDWNTLAKGISTDVPKQSIEMRADPMMYLLDVNALRDEDVDYKHYAAFHSKDVDLNFPGAYVMKGSSASALSDWLAFTSTVPFGRLVSKPANIAYPQFVDHGKFRVSIPASQGFTPESVTLDDLWSNRNLNPMIVLAKAEDGSQEAEYLQYATAVSLGAGIWEFSDCIRGLRGTEHLIGRAVNGNFVLFPNVNGMYREGESSEVGVTKYYQATTIGKTIPNNNPVVAFTNKSKALRPYSPADLEGSRSTAGDLLIDWKRRARKGRWYEGKELQQEESSERYNLYIYASSAKTTLLRQVLALTTSTYTYTKAMYDTDTGGGINIGTNVGFETGTSAGWTLTNCSIRDITDPDLLKPRFGNYFVHGNNGVATATAYQDIDVSAYAADIDAGSISLQIVGAVGESFTDNDRARMSAQFFDSGMVSLGTSFTAYSSGALNDTWLDQTLTAVVPANTRTIRIGGDMIRDAGTTLNAGIDISTVKLISSVLPKVWVEVAQVGDIYGEGVRAKGLL